VEIPFFAKLLPSFAIKPREKKKIAFVEKCSKNSCYRCNPFDGVDYANDKYVGKRSNSDSPSHPSSSRRHPKRHA
jgi:hypothetical protein